MAWNPGNVVSELIMGDFQPYIARDRRIGGFTFDMWITDPVADEWYSSQSVGDLPEFVWLFSHTRSGMKVADCGAHHGFLTVAFSKAVGPNGAVGAWEALPANAAVISKNLVLNGCHNVIVHPFALGDEHRTVRLWTHTSNTLVSAEYGNNEVQMVRLDDEILSQRPIIDLELHCCLFEDRSAVLAEIFSILEPLSYEYSVLATGGDVIRAKGPNVDLTELAGYDNPNVFCVPVS
jgi:FkbM family methyltransferase